MLGYNQCFLPLTDRLRGDAAFIDECQQHYIHPITSNCGASEAEWRHFLDVCSEKLPNVFAELHIATDAAQQQLHREYLLQRLAENNG